MILIKLQKGEKVVIDEEDLEVVSRYKWYYVEDNGKKYCYTNISGTTLKMHRLIMRTPKDMVVDHINGNGLDNRKINLRNVPQHINAGNVRRVKRRHKLPQGISVNHGSSKKYRTRIKFMNREFSLGTYNNLKTAVAIYRLAYIERNIGTHTLDTFIKYIENLKKYTL